MPDADPLHKVTIIPRGMALGLTMQLPLDDKHSYNKEYLEAQLAILMAGRIAEEIFMHHITTGAGNDIERATDMARKMVCEWGMSELGPMSFGKKEEQIFLGREIAQHRDYSEATAIRIDEQVRKLVEDGYDRARKIIEEQVGRAGAHRRSVARARSAGRRRSAAADRRARRCRPSDRPKPMPPDGGEKQQVIRPEGGKPRSRIARRRAAAARVMPDASVPDFPSTCSTSTALWWTPPPTSAAPSRPFWPPRARTTSPTNSCGATSGVICIDLFQDLLPECTREQMDQMIADYRAHLPRREITA